MSENSTYDYGDFQVPENTDDQLKHLTSTAAELKEAQAQEARLEEELKAAKARVKHLSERALPELMDAVGMEKFVTTDGIEIAVDERIRASIPAARHKEAMDWLDEHDFSDLVKRSFVIEFGRDDDKWASKFERDLKQRKKALNVKQAKKVHPQTLAKLIKDELEKGTAIPLDLFGAFRQRYTKIKV